MPETQPHVSPPIGEPSVYPTVVVSVPKTTRRGYFSMTSCPLAFQSIIPPPRVSYVAIAEE